MMAAGARRAAPFLQGGSINVPFSRTRSRAAGPVAGGAAFADWDPGMPAKWVQLPDLSTDRHRRQLLRRQSAGYILADDFECTETGPITDIHIWGSWLDDHLPDRRTRQASTFTLSIHADIPAEQSPTGYSMPGECSGSMDVPARASSRASSGRRTSQEGWMDPPEDYIVPGRHHLLAVQLHIPASRGLRPAGHARRTRSSTGWTCRPIPDDTAGHASAGRPRVDHWNDDAVWGYGDEPYLGPWYELHLSARPRDGRASPSTWPSSSTGDRSSRTTRLRRRARRPSSYPTLLANNGARHLIVPGMLPGRS